MDSAHHPTRKEGKISIIAFALLLLGAAAAVFINGGVQEGARGVFLLMSGVVLLFCPPQARVEGKLWMFLVSFLFFSASALLPEHWFAVPEWRLQLQRLSIPLGKQVSPVPTETAYYLGLLAICGVLCLFQLAHPLRFRTLLCLTTIAIFICLIYSCLAIYSFKSGWVYPFDNDQSFGFFPNRNQTATLLVTGCIMSLGVIAVAGKSGKWVQGLIAAFGMAGCGTALLVYSESRGGVLFLLVGTLLWLIGIGRSRWSRPLVISFVTLFLAVTALFFVSKGAARNRLIKQMGFAGESKLQGGVEAGHGPDVSSSQEITMDARIPIFKDTWRMLCQYPITGVGLGAYRYVYNFYRQDSLTLATSIHPESDWLMVATESGPLSLVVLLIGGTFLFFRIRDQRGHSYWPLRWGLVCAALTAILHGVVDVPAHQLALSLWILVIVGAGLQISREKENPPPFWQRIIFWVAGAGAICLGMFLIRSEWFGGLKSPLFRAKQNEFAVYDLYQKDPAKAAAFSKRKIAESPMSDELYYQQAIIQLNTDGTDEQVDALFAAQRALNPWWPEIPVKQGTAWINLDTNRTATLWIEAIDRMRKIDQVNRSGQKGTPVLYENLLRQSEKYPDLQHKLYAAAKGNVAMILLWLQIATPAVVQQEIPQLSQNTSFIDSLQKPERSGFLRSWYEKGDRTALFEFGAAHPDWKDAVWPLQIRQLADEKNFQGALLAVVEKLQLDLSLPIPGSAKTLIIPEDNESALANFDYFWKAGNEVTARRIIEEARLKVEKSGTPFPEIWKKSTSLLMREEKWELAWLYLQRYLRESALDEPLR